MPFPDHEARGTTRHDAENSHREGPEIPMEDPGHSACPQQHGRKSQHESADELDEFSAAHSITPAHTPLPGRQCATALGSRTPVIGAYLVMGTNYRKATGICNTGIPLPNAVGLSVQRRR